MIDMHTHMLFGVDDGSESLEESIKAIKEGFALGFNTFVLTPHYIDETTYTSNVKANQKKHTILKKALNEKQIDVNIILANEVMFNENITSLLDDKEIKQLTNTNYLIMEIPRVSIINNFKNVIDNLMFENIIPIIVHPERCYYFNSNIDIIKELVNKGTIIQVNTGSIAGKHGKTASKVAKYLLKNNLVHLLATDSHHSYNALELKKAYKFVRRIGGNKLWETLFTKNPQLILDNQKPVLPNRKALKHEK
ncbi:MAG: hypothetical protein PHE54_05255 [Bacilli bacterium]|nr:hypothetical protein [Bacilli bacterium]